MLEKITLNLYDVKKSGYYKDNSSILAFCDLNELLNDLKYWISGKDLNHTKTFGKEDYTNMLPVYCLDIAYSEHTGDFLLTTWNEVPTEQGNFASLNLGSKVGEYDIKLEKIPKNHVPGYATYFWFIPSMYRFLTVRFNNNLNGHQGLKLYFKNYLKNYSSWVIDDGGSEEREILGYGDSIYNYDANLNPIFESKPSTKAGDKNYLINNTHLIRKVMRKNRLSYKNLNNRNFSAGLFRKLGINNDFVDEETYHDIKFEISCSLNENQVKKVFDHWEKDIKKSNNQFDDVGFRLSNGEDYWLSRIIIKKEFEVQIKKENDEVVNANSLLNALINEARPFLVDS